MTDRHGQCHRDLRRCQVHGGEGGLGAEAHGRGPQPLVGQLRHLQGRFSAGNFGFTAHEDAEFPGGEAYAAALLDPGRHLLGFAA